MGALRLADYECPFSIWIEADQPGRWIWELIDREGRTSMTGQAADQIDALIEAKRAALAATA